MQRLSGRTLSRGLSLACVLALGAPVAAQATNKYDDYRQQCDGRAFYATDDKGNLLKFREGSATRIEKQRAITGLPAGVSLKGIDFRPATGDLYGLGSDARIYRVSTRTAIACAEGSTATCTDSAPLAGGLRGMSFGFDFNPMVDRIRITSEANQNLRANPNNGALAFTDPDLQFGPGSGVTGDPNVVGSAYRNSSFSAMLKLTTELYAVDSKQDLLLTQNPPNAGTLVEPLKLGVDVADDLGFDIAGSSDQGYIATNAGGSRSATLYKVDLETGSTQSVSRIGNKGGVRITGLAAVQDQQ